MGPARHYPLPGPFGMGGPCWMRQCVLSGLLLSALADYLPERLCAWCLPLWQSPRVSSRSARRPAGQRLKAPFTKIPLTLRPRVLSQHPLLFAAVPAATFLASPRVTDTGVRPLR